MANVDLDILKDIPGYKAIFKAILKSQIQQLVEQLVRVTEEESVILTASIADGTLSHLGSESGKFFLEDHEDVKSQFLGFCLKRHHKKKQQEKDEEALKNLSTMPSQYMTPDASQTFLGMDHTSQMSPIPISISRATPRNRSMRHDPYRRGRGGGGGVVRGSSINLGANIHSGVPSTAMFSGSVSENSPVKIEGNSDGNGAELEDNSLVGSKTGSGRHESEGGDSEASNFATGELGLNESDNQMPGERELNTGQTGLGSDSQTLGSELDPNIGIKLEAVTDVDELEITGVEPGRPVMAMPSPRDNWGAYDSSLGATGSQADMSPQPDYNPVPNNNEKAVTRSTRSDSASSNQGNNSRLCCIYCSKGFASAGNLKRHMRIHEGIYPYICDICNKGYSDQSNFKKHRMVVHYGDMLGLPK